MVVTVIALEDAHSLTPGDGWGCGYGYDDN